jgi:hypothetical protein
VGAPFVSRHKNKAGLCFPDIARWGTFICEACTIHAVTNPKLTDCTDGELLALEQMQLIDIVC